MANLYQFIRRKKNVGMMIISIPIIVYCIFILNEKITMDRQLKLVMEHSDSTLVKFHAFLERNLSAKEMEKLLLNNTDYSYLRDLEFTVNQYKKENKGIVFEDFCEYVLPPFIYDEEIEDWRTLCYEKFTPVVSGLDVYEICDTVNKVLGEYFMFKNVSTKHRYKNWSSFNKINEGDCRDMSQIALYPFRSLGYATAIDYVVAWGNANGGHRWNVLMDSTEWKPFMGFEHEIGFKPFLIWEYKPDSTRGGYRYPAKIFRRTFSINQEYLTISKQVKNKKQYSALFSDLRFKDVTSAYFNTSNIVLKCDIKSEKEVFFLNVFNGGRWEAVAATLLMENDTFSFKDVKSDMLYYLTSNSKIKEFPCNIPFILRENNEMVFLVPNKDKLESFDIEFLYPRIQEYLDGLKYVDWSCPEETFDKIAEDKSRKRPVDGIDYHLYYYESEWRELTTNRTQNKILRFNDIPTNALLILRNDNGQMIGRPFTVENGKNRFW